MVKFILVHYAKDASPIVINSNNIVYVEKSDMFTGATYIQLNGIDREVETLGFDVTETPEQIFEMLK